MTKMHPALSRARTFCERFGLRLPILLAPMAEACPLSLSITVADVGGLRVCGALLMQPKAILDWAAVRHDFVQGDWPAQLKRDVADQAKRFIACLEEFARSAFGRTDTEAMHRAQFVLADVPGAAVRPHLQRREIPPPTIDDLIRATYEAIVGDRANRRRARRRNDRA